MGSRGAGVGSRIAPSFGSGKRGLGVIGVVVRAVTYTLEYVHNI